MNKKPSRRLRASLFLSALLLGTIAPMAFAEKSYEYPSDPPSCTPRWSNAWCIFN